MLITELQMQILSNLTKKIIFLFLKYFTGDYKLIFFFIIILNSDYKIQNQ